MSFVRLLALLAALLVFPGCWGQSDQVTLRLNWYLGGLHAPFYLGVERGYYAEQGVELVIREGRGSGMAAQSVAAGSDTFGMSDGGTIMLGASRGQPIRAVMSLLNTSPFAVIYLEQSGIQSIDDLAGRSIAVSPGDALTQLFPAVLAAQGLDAEAVNLVFMDPPAKPRALMAGRVDALLGGVDDQLVVLQERGYDVGALRFADLGVNTVGMAIHVHERTLRDRPELVQGFVTATLRAWQAAREDPDAAVDAALRAKPDLDRQVVHTQLLADLELLFSPQSKVHGLGYGALEDWQLTMNLLTEYRGLQTDRDVRSFFTNEFLP